MPNSLIAARTIPILRGMLHRGFTTVRDGRRLERQATYLDDGRALASSLLSGVTGGCGLAPKHHGLCVHGLAVAFP